MKEKGKKWGQIGKISASAGSRAVDWEGGNGGRAWRHAFDATDPLSSNYRVNTSNSSAQPYSFMDFSFFYAVPSRSYPGSRGFSRLNNQFLISQDFS